MPALRPGRYAVRAELSGFQTQTRTGIGVAVGQAVTVNFQLPVGTLQDQLTVTGESPLVEVTQTVIGTKVTQRDIESLPMQGREQTALLALVPGLTPNLTAGSFEGTNYTANGRDTGSNLYLVDGIHNKDDRSMGFSQTRVTVDSTAEYQVLTHDYGAEYGGAAGVIVNAVTKSGTNEFRGSAFYYLQDSSLDATNYFLKLAGEKNPDSSNKSVGGNIGGPLFRNKAFSLLSKLAVDKNNRGVERRTMSRGRWGEALPVQEQVAQSHPLAEPGGCTQLWFRYRRGYLGAARGVSGGCMLESGWTRRHGGDQRGLPGPTGGLPRQRRCWHPVPNQNLDAFNSDYDALEMSLDRRLANRWSGRLSYTLSRARDVAATSAGDFGIVNKRVNLQRHQSHELRQPDRGSQQHGFPEVDRG